MWLFKRIGKCSWGTAVWTVMRIKKRVSQCRWWPVTIFSLSIYWRAHIDSMTYPAIWVCVFQQRVGQTLCNNQFQSCLNLLVQTALQVIAGGIICICSLIIQYWGSALSFRIWVKKQKSLLCILWYYGIISQYWHDLQISVHLTKVLKKQNVLKLTWLFPLSA